MSTTIRYPFAFKTAQREAEPSLIITILPSRTGTLPVGGMQNYVSIQPWRTAGARTESPFQCIAIEFRGNSTGTIGDGSTELIGLYGQINLVATPTSAAQRQRQLLAILGVNLGAALPQVLVAQQAGPASDFVGTTVMVNNVAVYDELSIGGVTSDVAIPENITLSVVARPIFEKDYLG